MRPITFVLVMCLLTTAGVVFAQGKLVELTEADKPYQGRIAARTEERIWLIERDGRMRTLEVGKITAFRKLSDTFSPFSAADLRDQLRRELLDGMDVVGTGHYLVAGPTAVVRDYAQIFEDQYRAVYSHFSVRGFDVKEPEFPLVAIVFPDQKKFARYASHDKVTVGAGLKGYYLQSSNRVALFHEAAPQMTHIRQPFQADTGGVRQGIGFGAAPFGLESLAYWANTEGDLQSTMIHEATHQVAFNIGIHPRIGSVNPRWVVEGLATVFEAPGMRSSGLARTPGAKFNMMRLAQFRDFVQNRRQAKSLGQFIASDGGFGENVLDGYAQAWALSYFLIETRSREYSRYLKLIAARANEPQYTDEHRLADFRTAFGTDLNLLEAKFLRFMTDAK